MCNSKAEGGVRCDVHLKATSVLFDYTDKTSHLPEQERKSIWSQLKAGFKDAPDPTKAQYNDFIEQERWRVNNTNAFSFDEKLRLNKKLDEALQQNLPSGAGFAAMQSYVKSVRRIEDLKRKKSAAARYADQAAAQHAAAEAAAKLERRRAAQAAADPYDDEMEYAAWPIPQASDLDKVSTVIDSISHSATTAESIGEAIDVGNRNGAYYANAAGYIGLVEKHKDIDGVTHYSLTTAGQTFAMLDAQERTAMLSNMVYRTPLGKSYLEDPNSVEKEIAGGGDTGGHSETVAKRRASTINTWMTTLSNSQSLASSISKQSQDTIARSVEASRKQQLEAERRKRERAAQQVVGEQCSTCFMIKPVSGVCPNCD